MSASDTLHRHELSHHAPAGEGGNDRTHRITVKTFRACFSCATARVRCSGGMPCGRCETRSLECQYPTKRRSKAKLRNETLPGVSSAEMHERDLQTTQASPPRLSVDNATTHHLMSFSVNGVCESQPSPKDLTNTRLRSPETDHLSGRKGTFTRASDLQRYTGSSGGRPVAGYISAQRLQPCNTMSNFKNFNLDMASPEAGRDQEMALNFGHPSFDQSMLSALNWLPDDLLSGTSHDQAQHGLHPQQWSQPAVQDSHASCMAWQPPSIQNSQTSPSTSESVSRATPGHLSLGTGWRSPRRYSHVAGETSSQGRSVVSGKRPADYSVNHNGAHLSNNPGSQTSWSTPESNTSSERPLDKRSVHQFAFPNMHELQIRNIPDHLVHSFRPIEASTYNKIHRNFLLLCRNDNPFFSKFESENFPSVDDCNRYLVCYFHSFQAIYSLIHLPSFDPNRCHWILTLAVVAIGSHCSEIREADRCTAAFHELIRRAIFCEVGSFATVSLYISHLFDRKKSLITPDLPST